MGVLDELGQRMKDLLPKLPGDPSVPEPEERIVETEIPRDTRSSLQKLGERIGKQEAIDQFVEYDTTQVRPGALTLKRDEAGALIPPPLDPKFVEKYGDPSRTTEAMAAKRRDEVRAKSAYTIGKSTEKTEEATATLPPGMTWGTLEGARDRNDREDEFKGGGTVSLDTPFGKIATIKAGNLNAIADTMDQYMGSFEGAAGRTAGALLNGAKWISKVTGQDESLAVDLLGQWSQNQDFWRDYFKAKAGKGQGMAGKMAEAAGQLTWDLPQIIGLGTYGLAAHGAAYGLAEGGIPGMFMGGLQGGLTHGIFKGINGLPSIFQVPAAVGIGAGMEAVQGAPVEDVLAGGATWGLLSKPRLPGTAEGTKAEIRDFVNTLDATYPEFKQAAKNIKGERAGKRLMSGGGITKEEFILRFPEMRAHMNDAAGEGIMQSLDPNVDIKGVRAAGGSLKVWDFVLSKLENERRIAGDMVRQKISLPPQNVVSALSDMASKFNDIDLQQRHLMSKMQIRDGAEDMAYWQESLLRLELEKRGVNEVITGQEAIESKYGPQGWDDITGHTAVERQAIAELQAELNRRGIMTGQAAARAEADMDAKRGPIPTSILKAAYSAKLGQMLGMPGSISANDWLDYFQTGRVKKGVRLVDAEVSEVSRDAFRSLGQRKAYWTRPGYLMVPTPKGHSGGGVDGMIGQHRLVLEAKIGRELRPDEVAHHKNHLPWDNDPANLEVRNVDEHLRYHASPEGRAIDAKVRELLMNEEPLFGYQMEDFNTGEMWPVGEDWTPGKRQVKYRIQRPKRTGGTIKEPQVWGEDFEPWEVEHFTRGKVPAGPAGGLPIGATLPGTTDIYLGPENIKVSPKTGEADFIANVKGQDGQRYTKEIGRLTPEERDAWIQHINNPNATWQEGVALKDQIYQRITMDRPAGGTLPPKSSPAGKPKTYYLQQIKGGNQMRMADENSTPKPGWVLEEDGVPIKKGDGIHQRDLDEIYPPKVKKAPAGVQPYDKGLFLNSDFKDREQLTVRDVVDGHAKNEASTVNPWDGDMAGTDMWAVSLYPERTTKVKGKNVTETDIYNFYRKNADLLAHDPRLNVGTWWDKDSDTTFIDVTALLPKADGKLAEDLGRKYNQKAITLLDKEYSFPTINLGGTGEVLKGAGWLPEGERMNELYKTGEEIDLLHFGRPQTTPHSMGGGEIGAEKAQFGRGYTGRDMLTRGNFLKSNFYTPETKNVETHLWAGKNKIFGRGPIDKGQLFDTSKAKGKLSLDQQAIRAGKRGWYDPKTNQVRLFTPIELQRRGIFKGGPNQGITGKNIEDFVEKDTPDMTAEKGAPKEDYSKSPIFGKPKGSIQTSGQDVIDTVDRLRFLLFDKFHPIHNLMKMAEKAGVDVPIMENPSILTKLLGGVSGRAEARVFHKNFKMTADGNIQWTGESLRDIYKPHKGDMAGLDDFLVARAALEEEALNANRTPDERVETGVDPVWAQQTVAAGQARYGASAKKFTSFFHEMIQEMKDAGLIDQETLDGWKTTRPNYAPLRRDLEAIATVLDQASGTNQARQTLDRVQNPVKKRRGSDKPVLPPTQAAVMMAYEMTSAIERNRAANAIVNLRNLTDANGNPTELATLIQPTRPKITYVRDIQTGKDVPTIGRQESDTISVTVDGKRQFYKVPEDVAQSMKLIYETGLGRWTKLMAIPARTLRTGATAAPEFAFRNPLRDWLNAFMNAKEGFNPITDFPRGMFDLLGQSDKYWKWKASGGEWSMMVSLDKSLGAESVRRMHQETDTGLKALRKYIKSPIGYLEKVSELGEKPTRLGVFRKASKKGLSDIQAAVESREASTDFAVRGAETKAMSAIYTFLNARAQTTLKLGKTAVENPAKFALKGMAAAGIPSIVLYALNRDDPEYWKRDQQERDLYWFLPVNIGGRQLKIPKGEIGLIFGTGVEKILQALDADAETRPKVTQFLNEVWQNLIPIGNAGETLPTFARPIAEWVNNKSYYYGTPLESESDEAVAPYLRFKPGTSETMKSLGKVLGIFNRGEGVSPIKLENTLRGYTGGVGRHTLHLIDLAAEKLGIQDKGPRPADPMNIPGVSGFVSRRASGFESEPAKVFYKTAENVELTKRTLERLMKEKGERAEEVLTWIKNHPTEMKLMSMTKIQGESGTQTDLFNKVKRDLAELRKLENMISENKELTADQKREALNVLDKRVSALVDPVWKLINAVSSPGRD